MSSSERRKLRWLNRAVLAPAPTKGAIFFAAMALFELFLNLDCRPARFNRFVQLACGGDFRVCSGVDRGTQEDDDGGEEDADLNMLPREPGHLFGFGFGALIGDELKFKRDSFPFLPTR